MEYKRNSTIWKDIVLVNGNYHYVLTSIDFLNLDWNYIVFSTNKKDMIEQIKKLNPELNIFNMEEFYKYIEKTFSCNRNNIKTYVLNNIDVSEFFKERINLDDLGGYINGIKIS